MFQKRHVLPAIVLLAILLVAGWQRAALLRTHFGHVDDLGVALSITEAQARPMDSAFLREQIRQKEHIGRGTGRTATLRRLLDRPIVARTVDALAPLYPFVAVPLVWTYAPLPFLATPLLVSPDEDYATIKARGRLPSLMFALAAIGMIGLVGWRVAGSIGIVAAVPLAFSREFVVMSAQMHSYAATVFTAAALLWLTIHDARTIATPGDTPGDTSEHRTLRFVLSRGAALGLSCYLSYQAILLVPGYLAALAIARLRGSPRRDILARLTVPVALGGIFTVAILPAWLFRLRSIPAVNWNAGPHDEFLFHPASLTDAITTLPWFFGTNGWLTVTAILAPVAPDSGMGRFLAGIWLLLAVIGLAVALWRHTRPILSAVAIYTSTTLAIIFVFVVAGKLTLSPTRHLLVLLPLLALLGAIGLTAIVRPIGRSPSAAATLIVGLAFAGSAVATLPTLVRERTDRFSEARVIALVRAVRPDLVLGYDWTVQPMLMPSVRRQVPVALADPVGIARPIDPPAGARILLLSHRGPVTETACRTVLERLDRVVSRPCLAHLAIAPIAADAITTPEVEASPRTRGGGNGFFATLIRLPERSTRQRSRAGS